MKRIGVLLSIIIISAIIMSCGNVFEIEMNAFEAEALMEEERTPLEDVERLSSFNHASNLLSQNQSVWITGSDIIKRNRRNWIRITADMSGTDVGKVYLMELKPYEYSIEGKEPIASASSDGAVTFEVELGDTGDTESRLFSKFVIAGQNPDGSYTAVSNAKYINNVGEIAENQYEFPEASTKKGLQVNGGMTTDVVELGVKHAAVNLYFERLLRENDGIRYRYKGNNYYFNRYYIYELDRILKGYYENDITVSFVVLLGKSLHTEEMLYDAAENLGDYEPNHYAWDTSTQADAERIEAIMTFLGERYTREDGLNGQVVNWIMGNELNSPMYYNWMGFVPFDIYVNEMARTYRIFSTALKSCYSNVRTYFCLDYMWGSIPENENPYGAFSGRELLDALDQKMQSEGDISWNIAYHAYSHGLVEPEFWDDDESLVNDNVNSPVVNMKNIDVLTGYVEEHFGTDTRIILSEQGFSSGEGMTEEGMRKQAAAYAYAYYISEAQPMIDSFILARQVDHAVEIEQNLYFGLWSNQRGQMERADKKKLIWTVFKYIDTPDTLDYTNSLLNEIDGVEQWDDSQPRLEGFSVDTFLEED